MERPDRCSTWVATTVSVWKILHHVTGGADGDLLADQPPWHRVQRLPGLDVTVRGDPPTL